MQPKNMRCRQALKLAGKGLRDKGAALKEKLDGYKSPGKLRRELVEIWASSEQIWSLSDAAAAKREGFLRARGFLARMR